MIIMSINIMQLWSAMIIDRVIEKVYHLIDVIVVRHVVSRSLLSGGDP